MKSNIKRLALYVFYEKRGQLRRWNQYYLESLKECVDDIVVIVNGVLDSEGRKYLESNKFTIFERENCGDDFGAWRDVILDKGFDAVASYDELVLCNCSCYGPVFPFSKVFAKMVGTACDFWGLFDQQAIEGEYPHHLQSYFLVLRKNVLSSDAFGRYWKQCCDPASCKEPDASESGFTVYFEKAGFISASYLDNQLGFWIPDPTIAFSKQMLEHGFPLLKRKVFTGSYEFQLKMTDGSQGNETLDYLKKQTTYPVDIIVEDLVCSMENSTLQNALHLTYPVEDKEDVQAPIGETETKVAAVVYSYYEDLIDYNLSYLRSLPKGSDVYVVVVSDRLKVCWSNLKNPLPGVNVIVRKQPNRGRNEAAYWLTCSDVVAKYDYICLVHDKKTPSARPPIIGYYFSKHCFDGVLKSPAYVVGILKLFRENPRLGILMPMTPQGFRVDITGNEWRNNLELGKKVYRDLRLTVPFDMHPKAPWGAMFWIRGGAMKALYRHSWTIEDFPVEPLQQINGTILHALERMYPMIAQESGYLSGWIVPTSKISVYLDSLYYTFQKKKEFDRIGAVIHWRDIKQMFFCYVGRKIGLSGLFVK